MSTPPERDQDPGPKRGPGGKRRKLRTRDRIWLAVSKVLGVAHKTNPSGNNMSQR